MTNENAVFGELRSLAHRPGEASWAAICAALEAVDEDLARTRFVPYLEGNLRRWPAVIRKAPWAWIERALAGEQPPGLRLVGSVSLMNRKNVYRKFAGLVRDEALSGVRHLRIDFTAIGRARGVRALAASPLAGQLEELHVAQAGLDDDALIELLTADFPNLRALHLERNDLSQWGISELLDRPLVLELEELHIDSNPIGPTGAALLATAPFTRLKVLSMGTTELGDQGLIELCDGVGFSHVERLELARCDIGSVGASALEVTNAFSSLKYLSVWSNALGAAGITHISNARHMPDLTYVGLAKSHADDEAVGAIANRPGLTRIDLRLNDFGEAGCAAMSRAPEAAGLEALFLSFNSLRDEGAAELFRPGTTLSGLRQLELARCYIYSDGAEAMAKCPELHGLRELELTSNYINTAAGDLARSDSMSELRMLGVEMCGIGDDEAVAISTSPNMSSLVALYIGRNSFEDIGARALMNSAHDRLVALDLGDGEQADALRATLASRFVDAPSRRVRCREGSINYTLSALADLEEADWDAFADAVLEVDEG